jgi:hypothetical protein
VRCADVRRVVREEERDREVVFFLCLELERAEALALDGASGARPGRLRPQRSVASANPSAPPTSKGHCTWARTADLCLADFCLSR